ncbi:MAG: prenyltransferase/squalene oxidase repeat-containing protein, partial [Planctomycetota bacterium]
PPVVVGASHLSRSKSTVSLSPEHLGPEHLGPEHLGPEHLAGTGPPPPIGFPTAPATPPAPSDPEPSDPEPSDPEPSDLGQPFGQGPASRMDSPPWLVSLIVHLLVLLTLALISTSVTDGGHSLLIVRQPGSGSDLALAEFAINAEAPDDLPNQEAPVNASASPPIEFDQLIEWDELLPTIGDAPPSLGAEGPNRPPNLTSMFDGRTGAAKEELLQRYGGTQQTEDAVAMGLQWLARQQSADGTWGMQGPYPDGGRTENRVSATAMAMLAFMGAGHTHRDGPYAADLRLAVRWLARQQDGTGYMAQLATGIHEAMYSQAQATIVLCELYAMTEDSWLRPYAQRACDFACESQSPQGGWRYAARIDSDTSVTGWFLMGLKSGEAAGLEVDRYVLKRVDQFLDSVSDRSRALYAYHPGLGATPSMTAEGLLCRQYLGWSRNMPGMEAGLRTLSTRYLLNPREQDVYYWYYATQSLHHYGGPMWDRWNERLRDVLPSSQVRRGPEAGSWHPGSDEWGVFTGRLYTTCFSLYCLEVYYRHMPLYTETFAPS